MDLTEIKSKAADAFSKGKFAKAGELYAAYCAKSPKDAQSRVRMGDAWAKAGEKQKAIAAYSAAAETFAKEGFLPRAIAASKLILELDPSHQGVQQMLAGLYARKGTAPAASPPPTPAPVKSAVVDKRASIADFNPEPAADDKPLELGSIDEPPFAPPQNASASAEPEGIELDLEPAAPAGPPGLQPRKSAPESDSASQLPAELELAQPPAPEVELAPEPEPEPPPAAEPTDAAPFAPLKAPPPGSDLESSLKALAAKAPAPAPAAGKGSQFTELELSGDSILQALELAAGGTEVAEPESEAMALAPPPPPPAGAIDAPLPNIPLFSDLPPDAFIELFERCPLRRFSAGQTVIEQGTRGDAFYVICEGSVRVIRTDNGQRKQLALLQHGSFFGEMALLSGAPRAASVESASDDTQLLEISAKVLEPLSRRFPAIAQALKKFCRQRLLTNLMDTSALFRPFGREDRRKLVGRFKARDVRPGEVILKSGNRSDGLYVVLSGEVEVVQNGRRVATVKEGEIFGEMSLLTKSPAVADVKALRKTSLLRLPREDFDTLILVHPHILMMISDLSANRKKQLANSPPPAPGDALADEPLMMV